MAVRSPPTDESDIEDAIPREPFAWVLSLAFPPHLLHLLVMVALWLSQEKGYASKKDEPPREKRRRLVQRHISV